MTANLALIERAAEHLIAHSYECWSYGDSIGFEALLAASDVTGDPRYAAFAHGYFRAWATRAAPYRELDNTAPGLAIVEVAERTGDGRLLEAAIRLAEFLASRRVVRGAYVAWERTPLRHPVGPSQLPPDEAALLTDPGAGIFVDCMHFDPPFFTALGRVSGNARYSDIGITQARGLIALLQNTTTGIFDHFWLEKTERSYVPGWGRGQGWALLGLLDVLEQVGPDRREELQDLSDAARSLAEAMLNLQRPDGHWYAVAQDPESGEEASTAAFMATGFRRGCHLGLLDDRFEEAEQRARAAACDSTSEDGILTGVSAAVWACTFPLHYAHVPRGFLVPWGQGPLVLALAGAREVAGEAPE